MPQQTFQDLHCEDENHYLTLCLHNGNMEEIKNIKESNTFYNYLINQNILSSAFTFENNIVISDTFIMVDLRKQQFKYNGTSFINSFKDSFVDNKFYKNNVFPIFFIKDLYIDIHNTTCNNYISRHIQNLSAQIISDIM